MCEASVDGSDGECQRRSLEGVPDRTTNDSTASITAGDKIREVRCVGCVGELNSGADLVSGAVKQYISSHYNDFEATHPNGRRVATLTLYTNLSRFESERQNLIRAL